MKRLGYVSAFVMLVLVLVSLSTSVSGLRQTIEYSGVSPTIGPGIYWVLYVDAIDQGDMIFWHWNSSGNATFWLVYTSQATSGTNRLAGLQKDDGLIVSITGWYQLLWFNNGTSSMTVSYKVDVGTPALKIWTPSESEFLGSHSVVVNGTTEGLPTGVLAGPDEQHLHRANVTGTTWVTTVSLEEGRRSIVVRSYYWLQPLGAKNFTLTRRVNVTIDTTPPLVSIVSPTNGTTFRGHGVPVYWNCSDPLGLRKVDMRIDDGPWATVQWGNSLGLGYEPIGLPTGEHTIEIRGTDTVGNYAVASTTVRTNANDWSFGGPMYGLPTIGVVLSLVALGLVAYFTYFKPRRVLPPPTAPESIVPDDKSKQDPKPGA